MSTDMSRRASTIMKAVGIMLIVALLCLAINTSTGESVRGLDGESRGTLEKPGVQITGRRDPESSCLCGSQR